MTLTSGGWNGQLPRFGVRNVLRTCSTLSSES